MALGIKDDDFKVISKVIKPNMVYVFFTFGLIIISLPLYFIGKKYSISIELIIPIFCIYVMCFLLPIWYENLHKPKRIAKLTLLHANNFTYICDMILLFFFSSHYAISVAGRLILTVCCLNMTFRRWLSGDSTLPPMLFNWFTTISLLECFSYKQNERMVQLFLEKEMVKKQEEQFKTILHNIPTNVIVVCDLKIVFKNRNSENLIKNVCDVIGPET
jgi:hypothetical protein